MQKVDIIVDLQYGSTGKGLIAGFLAKNPVWGEYDTVISANMPNAGHTFIDADGRKWMHKVLPNGIVGPGVKRVMIGPGAVFDYDTLQKELFNSKDLMANKQLFIHPNAVLLQTKHREEEERTMNGIASTKQGSGAALMEKMKRETDNDMLLAQHFGMSCTYEEWQEAIDESKNILAEGAQGVSLGLNTRFWPYTTSRDCTPARFMADMGIPVQLLREVIGTARTYPIRVGNTEGGFSGPTYHDQRETSWEELQVEAERTTVTDRVRRVFTFSQAQIEESIWHCRPNRIFLNFANYVPQPSGETATLGDLGLLIGDINSAAHSVERNSQGVRYLGWGPGETDVETI